MTQTRRILAAVVLATGAAALATPIANAGTPSPDIALTTPDSTASAADGVDPQQALGTAMASLVGGLAH
ncbi:hypothetical protein B4N89_31500 [Embleya scabrispora]|uniref:Uncharacterized protein n=1 Tax=Embleya scabrispora TaxID=159449 RepID=A0A1T3NP40_9ACTN|nr:hypothetical protein [Embleya scabrispora]OPC78693.1 hypothetical protein B4N89_31500 [Embleya scabrispora]